MNKMEQLASIFDKKLGEEFTIVYKNEEVKGKFTDEGLDIEGLLPRTSLRVLDLLLKEKAIILEE